MSDSTMAKAYVPSAAEARWYGEWENRGYFNGAADSEKKTYTIVIPPPNVTGILTLGHVLNNTLQDILIRWEKMRGREVCWVPGTDHAGIATQSKVEAYLKSEESLSRYDLGREKFLERVWEWKEKYGGTIIRQLRSLGVSCDWPRERFTLDDNLSDAVLDVFVHLYKKGLIYKGKRMINWCPVSHTALSDEEVIHKSTKGSLWHFRYPITGTDRYLVVATTRPETMLGDTGVAVHPDDPRYSELIGATVDLPIVNRTIPVFADDYVDREFGSGVVKVTPAHDPNDYEMGVKHKLDVIDVMNPDGTMNGNAGKNFAGLDRYECRKRIVKTLEDQGLVEKIDDYEHQVGYSERGHVPVEPRLSEQWFVRMEPLAAPALQVVKDGKIRFHPDRWVKTYNHWMENIKDWCISRQLWWGHRIPAYYCNECNELVVAKECPKQCPSCQSTNFHQDEDVLDTWFSSWLWPFSVFNWPQDDPDLHRFYPTQSLVTGPDIIFFWVARMIMAGLEFTGEIPFSDVYFTSIIRDDKGQKLSKSLNNSPDPLDVIATYGADALRFTVIYIAPVGQDIRYSNEKCEIGRNFANKLWNAARFREMQGKLSDDWSDLAGTSGKNLRADDKWILNQLNTVTVSITNSLENFDFHSYTLELYEFVWNQFCDWYVESAKAVFYGADESLRIEVLRVFDFTFSAILRLIHPVMPFVTEELFHNLGYVDESGSIMLATWPTALDNETINELGLSAENDNMVEEKFSLIKAGRNLRGNYNIPFSKKIAYTIKPTDPRFECLLNSDLDSVRAHLNAETVVVDEAYTPTGSIPSGVGKYGLIFMPLSGAIDVDSEVQRLSKQRDELTAAIEGIDKRLANDNFVSRAPAAVVEREREKRREFVDKIQRLEGLLSELVPCPR